MIINPGVKTELLDGNLLTQVTLPSDVVLIIDRAFSGPSNVIYPVEDINVATNLYGSNSPLITLARQVTAGGAQNIALYRIGGKPAEITNIFGEYTSLRSTAETLNSGQNLSVYIGPQVNDPSRACVIVWKADRIVFSNVPTLPVNTGEVIVEGFDPLAQAYRVGTINSPVAFSEVIDNLLESIIQTFVATAGQDAFTFTETVPTATAGVSVVKISGSTTQVLQAGVHYTTVVTGGDVTGLLLTDPALLDDELIVNYAKPVTSGEILANEIIYSVGEDSMSVNLNRLYELYDTAFEDLEAVTAAGIVLPDLFNSRNIAAGDDDSRDRNTYVYRTQAEDGKFEYEWSANKYLYQSASGSPVTTIDPLLAALDDNGQPIIVKTYSEVDFAHRLGTWCAKTATNTNYVLGVIGVKGPVSTYSQAINRWIGTEPVRNLSGTIIQNGTGLLGNRFMVGTTDRDEGLYATDTGYPDGQPLYDSRGVIVDLGKFLSIAVNTVSLLPNTTGKVATSSFAGVYAGMLRTITPGNSTTNQVIPAVREVFTMRIQTAEKLSKAGYVTLVRKSKGLVVYSGDLATRTDSDYDYVSTALAIAYVVKRLDIVTDSYIGRGIDQTLTAAFWNTVDTELKGAITTGVINGYNFDIQRAGPHRFYVPLTIIAKEELRAVNYIISLQSDNSTNTGV